MCARSSLPQPDSPLDSFLARFLGNVARLPDGFSLISDATRIAEVCEVEPAFVEALFVSARTRGLIEPHRSKGSRGRYRWTLSARGTNWLSSRSDQPSHLRDDDVPPAT
jgi:hypothetical protein